MPTNDPPTTSIPLPHAEILLTAYTDFLTIILHTLLRLRHLYPPTTFQPVRAFATIVYQSRHPAVISWVRDAVAAVTRQLRTGNVLTVTLAVHKPLPDVPPAPAPASAPQPAASSSKDKPPSTLKYPPPPPSTLECWHFSTPFLPCFPDSSTHSTPFAPSIFDETLPPFPWPDVTEAFRSVLACVSNEADRLEKVPAGSTFSLVMEVREEGSVRKHPQPWIPAEEHTLTTGPSGTTRPLRSAVAGPLFFECWLEKAS